MSAGQHFGVQYARGGLPPYVRRRVVCVRQYPNASGVDMGDISGWSKEPDRMFIGPL
jgi:hypothetical protein